MPQVLVPALIGGMASGAAAAATVGAAAFSSAFVTGFIVSGVSAGVSYALAEKPSIPDFTTLRETRFSTRRDPAAVASVIYGEVRTGGTVVYLATSEDDNFLHIVIVLAGHECQSIEEVYFNGKPKADFDQFNVGSHFRLRWARWDVDQFNGFEIDLDRGGTLDQFTGATANAIAASIDANANYTASAPGPGVIEIKSVSAAANFTISKATANLRVENFDETQDPYTWHNDQPAQVDTLKVGQHVYRINEHLGSASQTVDSDLEDEIGEWTSAHRLRGLCYLYVRLKWNVDAWQGEVPNITARVRGKKIYDPRGPSTAYSANPALIISDYLTDTVYGMGCVYADELDETALIAAANVCDEDVSLDAGGTENRYEAHIAFPSDSDPVQTLENLVQSMAGSLNYSGGTFIIHAGAWRAPTLSFDESDLIGPIDVQTGLPRESVINGVRGTFFSPENNDVPDDYPPILSSVFVSEDGGVEFWRDLPLNATNSSTMAQRITKIVLLQARQDIAVTTTFNLSAVQFRVGDVIELSNSRFGWTDKTFEVQQWALKAVDAGGEAPLLGIEALLRETAANLYDWSTSEETSYDPSPDTELPNPFIVQKVSSVVLNSTEDFLFVGQDGSLFTRVSLSWVNKDAFVTRFRIEARNVGLGLFETYAETSNTSVIIGPFKDGDRYDFRIISINYLGRESEPFTLTNKLIIGKTRPPPDVETFSLRRMPDGTREYIWTYPDPPLDLAGFEIRSAPGLGKAWSELTTLETAPKDARRLESNQLAAGAYTVGIKAFDTTGNYSVRAIIIDSTLGNPRLEGAVLWIDFAGLGWPGFKTNCWVDDFDGVLYPDSKNKWTDYTNWDSYTQWLERPVPEFIYEHTPIDLGGVIVFTPLISTNADATVTIEESHSDDGVSYSSWAAAGTQLEARYIKFRLTFSTVETS